MAHTQEEVDLELSDVDRHFHELALQLKDSVQPPLQSNFRVFAIMTYIDTKSDDKTKLHHVTGTNTETCFIGGTICAERSALLKLREEPNFKNFSIKTVYIVSDAIEPISPGVQCREFMHDFISRSARVVMFGQNSHSISTLGELYPHSPLYATIPYNQVEAFAKNFAEKMQTPSSSSEDLILGPDWLQTYENLCLQLKKEDEKKKSPPNLVCRCNLV